MHWQSKYKDGDIRTRQVFAWLPMKIGDRGNVWFGHYYVKERYYCRGTAGYAFGVFHGWIVMDSAINKKDLKKYTGEIDE